MESFLNIEQNSDVVSPESLAWKLLVDDDIEDFAGVLIPCSESSSISDMKTVKHDELIDQFQILITIYMELVFGLLKINHINNNLDENGEIKNVNLEESFSPDFSIFSIDDLLNLFKDKFKKIRYILNVKEISEEDSYYTMKYYCRIILKDTPDGKIHYFVNKNKLDSTKRYTFLIRNSNLSEFNQLSDFYAICALPNFKVKVYFSPINIFIN